MPDSPDVIYLWCIVINRRLEVLTQPFQLFLPVTVYCGMIIIHLKAAAPSLRGKDPSMFNLYKPLADISKDMTPSQLTTSEVRVDDFWTRLVPRTEIGNIFSAQLEKESSHIHLIICVDNADATTLGSRMIYSPINLVTIKLGQAGDIQQPDHGSLDANHIVEAKEMPGFVHNFNKTLDRKRSPAVDVIQSRCHQAVQEFLGGGYSEYFGSDNPTDIAESLEFIHYNEIVTDTQIIDPQVYRMSKQGHAFSLLRRLMSPFSQENGVTIFFDKSWTFPLLLKNEGNTCHWQYKPRNDFSIVVRNFPVLILEVASGTSGANLRRMQLQAACLVRLGNALMESPEYLVKAVYIDNDYQASEYTFFQRADCNQPFGVEYSVSVFKLWKQREMFAFIFRLYNSIGSMKALRDKLSMDFSKISLSIRGVAKQMPHGATPKSRRDGSTGTGSSPKSPTQSTSFRFRGQVLALIGAKGYDLLPEDDRRPWPQNILKATKSGDVFALKILKGASAGDEQKILHYLQEEQPCSRQSHVIKLIDTISLDNLSSSPDIDGHIIVMPWQSLLKNLLKRHPNMAGLLRCQFLEGVWFLHQHSVAHLDLKPGNVLVATDTSLGPQLSIIDFGMSIRVTSEETQVKGYRGTPTWTAPEVGTVHGPIMTYSAIKADRWSCGQMLRYFTQFHPTYNASFDRACDELLSPDPSGRPPLGKILKAVQAQSSHAM